MRKLCIALILSFFAFFCGKSLYASSLLYKGNVDNYEILINSKSDGSIDMEYNISLSLNADVQSVDNIVLKLPLGTPILKDYDYNTISAVDFDYRKANISLKRSYNAGEKIKLNFKINMSDVYRYLENKGLVIYRITIGDVKEFKNNKIVVKWNKSGVYFSGRSKDIDGYYVWKQNYSFFRSYQVMIQYYQSNFDMLKKEDFKIENFICNYGLIIIAFFVIVLEIKNNLNNLFYSKYSV